VIDALRLDRAAAFVLQDPYPDGENGRLSIRVEKAMHYLAIVVGIGGLKCDLRACPKMAQLRHRVGCPTGNITNLSYKRMPFSANDPRFSDLINLRILNW